MNPPTDEIIQKILDNQPVKSKEVYSLYEIPFNHYPFLFLIANYLRQEANQNVISYSKNVFIDITHLCRNNCSYCGFRQEPIELNSVILRPEKIIEIARKAKDLGCKEALLTMGEKPELKYDIYRTILRSLGNYSTTIEYLRDVCEKIFNETGLLPHSNPGIMERDELSELKEVNASLGLMLENVSGRLLSKGAPHELSPGKAPKLRLNTIKLAGELKIPFTTGILVGIGESYQEQIDSLLEIKKLNDKFGHIQEIIIQNFLPKKNTPMEQHSPPSIIEMMKLVCLARIIFNGKMNIQVPPNLNPNSLELLLMSGTNDWGGISPLTQDYVNPERKWPSIQHLMEITHQTGFIIKERLPIYPEFVKKDTFISLKFKDHIKSLTDETGFVKP
ncbi:MAG TPA: 7,8-didemethyl-8-hydroxy-5-deazariboflavin synthase CofG [Candidatus Deferrimicrobium sp.]|nr:7,8-didemethyl-8-hydroxy-5-deazariboflavin synthase CofG [Candidatus Deferrimicrobium sp.]